MENDGQGLILDGYRGLLVRSHQVWGCGQLKMILLHQSNVIKLRYARYDSCCILHTEAFSKAPCVLQTAIQLLMKVCAMLFLTSTVSGDWIRCSWAAVFFCMSSVVNRLLHHFDGLIISSKCRVISVTLNMLEFFMLSLLSGLICRFCQGFCMFKEYFVANHQGSHCASCSLSGMTSL